MNQTANPHALAIAELRVLATSYAARMLEDHRNSKLNHKRKDASYNKLVGLCTAIEVLAGTNYCAEIAQASDRAEDAGQTIELLNRKGPHLETAAADTPLHASTATGRQAEAAGREHYAQVTNAVELFERGRALISGGTVRSR